MECFTDPWDLFLHVQLRKNTLQNIRRGGVALNEEMFYISDKAALSAAFKLWPPQFISLRQLPVFVKTQP